jgi:hypothetical protein
LCLSSAALLIPVVVVPTTAVADESSHEGEHEHESSARVLLDGLSSPKGIALTRRGNVILGQGAFGPPEPVLEFVTRGKGRGTVNELTPPINVLAVAVSPLDDTGWALGPSSGQPVPLPAEPHVSLYHRLADGTVIEVLNLFDYQASDPDPFDQDQPPIPGESNPYGLTIAKNGDALVADAANNDIVRVEPDGTAFTVARFDLELISTADVPPEAQPPGGLPPQLTAEAVPTSVTIGPDGAIYVGQLMGFPFKTGSSHVWRIDEDANGALCSVNTPDPACTVFQSGLTAIQDIAFGKDGTLYVYELAAGGVFPFEAGLAPGGTFPPAVLLAIDDEGDQHELATGELSQPGGVIVGRGGKVYVTDGMFTDGRLLVINRDD